MSQPERPPPNGPAACLGIDLSFSGDDLLLRLSGLNRLLAHRRTLVLPRRRIHRAFVLGRQFAVAASPRLPALGWSTARRRIGTFGLGQSAQLWSVGRRSVVVALYLRGEPYHRVVLETENPVQLAAEINRWTRSRR